MATEYTPACPQDCILPPKTCPDRTSEDCLHLNVYAPSVITKPLPVMVYFHGGRFEQGSAGNILYEGKYIANMTEVIYVITNYRLGALGALALGELNGNYAINDQRLALKWVQRNIKNFGGDPSNVTIFGQSAGAGSIAAHLISNKSANLFHKVIMQSNPLELPFKTKESYKPLAQALAKEVGCPDYSISCLRSKSANEIVAAQKAAEKGGLDIFHPFRSILAWSPTVGPDDITMQPFEAFRTGKHAKVPIMHGVVTEEALLFVNLGVKEPLSDLAYGLLLNFIFGEHASALAARYPPNGYDNRDILSVLGDDYMFHCPSLNASDNFYVNSRAPVFYYLYNHTLTFDGWGSRYPFCLNRTCHGAELPLLFNTAPHAGFTITPDEARISKETITYWSNFAKSGDPNSPVYVHVKWLPYNSNEKTSIMFNTKGPIQVKNYRKAQCDFWDKIGYHYGA